MPSVPVAMMRVGKMRMVVNQGLMRVRMVVPRAGRNRRLVCMIVVLVALSMNMVMGMRKRLVGMTMFMPLR